MSHFYVYGMCDACATIEVCVLEQTACALMVCWVYLEQAMQSLFSAATVYIPRRTL